MSVKQAALHAGVSETTLRGWLAEGLLPHFRLGAHGRRGKISVAPADLDALLQSFKVGGGVRPTSPVPTPPAPKPVYKHIRA